MDRKIPQNRSLVISGRSIDDERRGKTENGREFAATTTAALLLLLLLPSYPRLSLSVIDSPPNSLTDCSAQRLSPCSLALHASSRWIPSLFLSDQTSLVVGVVAAVVACIDMIIRTCPHAPPVFTFTPVYVCAIACVSSIFDISS